jgi:hypothetical protein
VPVRVGTPSAFSIAAIFAKGTTVIESEIELLYSKYAAPR